MSILTRALNMRNQFLALPREKPVTAADLVEVYEAIIDIAYALDHQARSTPDPRLWTDDSARGGR